jgi:hypothetical protein
VTSLRGHPDSAGVQEWAGSALVTTTRDAPENKRRVMNEGGLEVLVATMRGKHAAIEEVAEKACWTMRNLTSNDADIRVRAGKAGVVEAVVAVAIAHMDSAAVLDEACHSLANLVTDNDDNTSRARLAGGIEAVIEALRAHPENVAVQSWGSRALRVLTSTDAENRVRVGKAGGVDVVLTSLRSHADNETVQEYACAAMATIIADNPEEQDPSGDQGRCRDHCGCSPSSRQECKCDRGSVLGVGYHVKHGNRRWQKSGGASGRHTSYSRSHASAREERERATVCM